ncbi:MAG: glycine betaine ABC transporter substrate-binding protein [Sedimentisphaeraceae bacterium JB056]
MKTTIFKLVLIAAIFSFVISGCKKADNSQSGQQAQSDTKKVKLAYVNWSEGVALTELMEYILTDMGYEVETTMADVAPIYAAIAGGDQDIMIETWVPVTHKSYWDKYSADFDELGTWFDKAKIGLVVPEYMEINSIEELNSVKDSLEGKITGIDAGAGIMVASEKAIEDYSLEYELISSSGPAMTAALKSAIDKKEPVVVTGWAPHWKFARYDLKFLEDPKGVYGSEEQIKFICRKGFKEDSPEVATLFANIKFDLNQIGSLMDAVSQADGNEKEAVAKWVTENQELVDGWKAAITQE